MAKIDLGAVATNSVYSKDYPDPATKSPPSVTPYEQVRLNVHAAKYQWRLDAEQEAREQTGSIGSAAS